MQKSLAVFTRIRLRFLLHFILVPVLLLIANFVYAASPQVAAGGGHTIGLKSDGTVVAVGDNIDGLCNVASWTNIKQVATGYYHTVGLRSSGSVIAIGSNQWGNCDVASWINIVQVAVGLWHTIGLKSDGTVIAVGDNENGQCDVGSWTDIVQVAAGGWHTVGLKSDGTVVAVGANFSEQCNVALWTDIVQVIALGKYTIGLRSDGRVLAVGENMHGQLNVSSWTDIMQLAAGGRHTVGLKTDGTVVAVGNNHDGPCDVASWTDIEKIAAGDNHTVGLKSDGTVVAVGNNFSSQCNVESWNSIQQVVSADSHTVGLKTDGTVIIVGSTNDSQKVSSWSGIKQIATSPSHIVGIKPDNTVVAVGNNYYSQCDISSWTDIVQVAAGGLRTVGLKSDGTVLAVGNNYEGACDVSSWSDILQIAAGIDHTIGLKSDGSVLAVGDNWRGQCNVSFWADIQQIAAGHYHSVGVKSNGTVEAVGLNNYGQCDVLLWADIQQVAAGYRHTIGLKSNGTVLAVGDNSQGQCDVASWTDIIQISAGYDFTIGLKSDGTVVATGSNYHGQISLYNWDFPPYEQYIAGHHTTGDEVWSGSAVYIVEGDITVPDGASLTIAPGGIVKCDPGVGISAEGALTADDVTFTWNQDSNPWAGITFTGPGSVLTGCTVEHVSSTHGAVSVLAGASARIMDCVFTGSGGTGAWIDGQDASATIFGCTISGFGRGIYIGENATAKVQFNTLRDNGYGIYLHSFCAGGRYNHNEIATNQTYGIYYAGNGLVDAADNFWGHKSGPLDDSDDAGGWYNPVGEGDRVSDHVQYTLWAGIAFTRKKGDTAAPVARAGSDQCLVLGEMLFVDAGDSYDPDGDIGSDQWQFAKNASAQGVAASYLYAKPGKYKVTLIVTDNDGLTGENVITVKVLPTVKAVADLSKYINKLDLDKADKKHLLGILKNVKKTVKKYYYSATETLKKFQEVLSSYRQQGDISQEAYDYLDAYADRILVALKVPALLTANCSVFVPDETFVSYGDELCRQSGYTDAAGLFDDIADLGDDGFFPSGSLDLTVRYGAMPPRDDFVSWACPDLSLKSYKILNKYFQKDGFYHTVKADFDSGLAGVWIRNSLIKRDDLSSVSVDVYEIPYSLKDPGALLKIFGNEQMAASIKQGLEANSARMLKTFFKATNLSLYKKKTDLIMERQNPFMVIPVGKKISYDAVSDTVTGQWSSKWGARVNAIALLDFVDQHTCGTLQTLQDLDSALTLSTTADETGAYDVTEEILSAGQLDQLYDNRTYLIVLKDGFNIDWATYDGNREIKFVLEMEGAGSGFEAAGSLSY